MDAGPSAVILFVRSPASDARERTVGATPAAEGAAVTPVVILLVCNSASAGRPATGLVMSVPGGAATMSAVILPVCRPASDEWSRTSVIDPVPKGAAVTRVSGRLGSKSPADAESGTVTALDGFGTGTLMPMRLVPVGWDTSVKSP